MRVLFALALLATPVRGDEPNARALLEAVEKQRRAVHDSAGPCVACVVVSRSELYPTPGNGSPGKLGDFQPAAFLKDNPGREQLARYLDLADFRNAVNHTPAGGVVIDASGLILTTAKTVDGATKVYVHVAGGKGSFADVFASDSRSDLAVLKLIAPPPGLKAVKFGEVLVADTPARRASVFGGKFVVSLRLPPSSVLAPDRPNGELGVLTNVRHKMYDGKKSQNVYDYGALLEHEAKLNFGISGGALVNLDGELVGLTTQAVALSGEGTPGYALPIDANTRRIIDVLRRGEEVEYGYLGVRMPNRFGVSGPVPLVLEYVSPQSPASEAGLRHNDRIIAIDGVPVSHFGDLLFHAGCALAGNKVRLAVERFIDGQARHVETDLTLGKYPADQPYLATVRPDAVFGLRVEYGSVMAFRLSAGGDPVVNDRGVPPGVCVRELDPGSPAEKKFRTLGDAPTRWLITKVNGTPTPTPATFRKAAAGQASVKLTLIDPTEQVIRPRDLTIP